MKNLLPFFLLFLMLVSLEVYAQNYSPIVNGNTSLFSDNSNHVAALHIDSTTSDSKGISYHFLKTWQESNECADYDQATWAGPKCVKNNNTYYFFNDNRDTIYFYPLKEVGTSWVFYKYANGNYIEATIVAKEQKTFLGLTDSVKTASLQPKDVNGNNLPNYLTGNSIEFSKDYGFTKPVSFLYFPDLFNQSGTHYELTLAGLTTPKVGTQLITSNDIYNYNIGDVFHYDTVYAGNNVGIRLGKKICTILEKSTSANTDTVIYKIARTVEIQTSSQTNIYNQKDTVIEKYILNEPSYYPEQAIPIIDPSLFLERKPFPMYKLIQNVEYNNRPLLSPSYYYPYYNGTCWQSILSEFATPTYSYGKGLGLVEYDAHPYDHNGEGLSQQYIRLVYFKKGNETWGTPLTLSNYTPLKNATASLFPNPLKQGEQLHIETNNFQTKQITIYNCIGIRMKDVYQSASVIEYLDLSELEPGLYVMQLLNEKNEFITSKLIIK